MYDRIIASKHKEILSPNLSLTYRLPGVDGYDGGLLPLKRYVDFVGQFAARERGSALDGRLREVLTGVPANTWLEKMGVRYVIADKTADIFIDGVYYDLLFGAPISPTLSPAATLRQHRPRAGVWGAGGDKCPGGDGNPGLCRRRDPFRTVERGQPDLRSADRSGRPARPVNVDTPVNPRSSAPGG